MKASFVSVLALAMSAFAAPTAQPGLAVRDVTAVQDAVQGISDVLINEAGAGQIIDGATKTPAKRQTQNIDAQQLITIIQSAVSSLEGQQSAIGDITNQLQAGDLTSDQAAVQSAEQLQGMKYTLTEVVTKLTGAAGLTVADSDVDTLLNLVVNLVSIVLATVKTLVTTLGIQPQLNSIIHSVFSLVSKLLVLVTGLVMAIVPGLVAALGPLLAGLGNGLLAPLLTPVAGLVAGLSGGM